uniref:Translocon-associated protein subunit alpha n=1 Tax=Gasterosteus aculeatus aculeatus TaxID=481459 RepID=A0AAQ4PRB1_GASAC
MEDEETEAADEDEDDEAEVEDDENVELSHSHSSASFLLLVPGNFPANEIVKFLLGFSNKGPENFVVESLDASFRYPQDYQFYIQNFTALQLGIEVPASRQATFEYSFIPAEPMGGRPFGLVINLNYKDANGNIFQDAVFNQTVTITEPSTPPHLRLTSCSLTYSSSSSLQHLPLRLPVGPRAAGRRRASPADRVQEGTDVDSSQTPQHLCRSRDDDVIVSEQLRVGRRAESVSSRLTLCPQRRRPAPKVEMGTSSHNDVDLSWIPQETLNQISRAPLSFCLSLCLLLSLCFFWKLILMMNI